MAERGQIPVSDPNCWTRTNGDRYCGRSLLIFLKRHLNNFNLIGLATEHRGLGTQASCIQLRR